MADVWDQIVDLIDKGGFVMPPLLVGLVVLWYALGYRALKLRRGDRRSLRMLVRAARDNKLAPTGVVTAAVIQAVRIVESRPRNVRGELQEYLGALERDLGALSALVRSIVAVAPLTGLLGTVSGMISTFDALAEMAMFAAGGGIAGGISEALFSTQFGLVVAIPGIIVGRLLARRERELVEELDELLELLCNDATLVRAA